MSLIRQCKWVMFPPVTGKILYYRPTRSSASVDNKITSIKNNLLRQFFSLYKELLLKTNLIVFQKQCLFIKRVHAIRGKLWVLLRVFILYNLYPILTVWVFYFILQEQEIIGSIQLQNTFSKQFLAICLNVGEVIITDNYLEENLQSIISFHNNMVFI